MKRAMYCRLGALVVAGLLGVVVLWTRTSETGGDEKPAQPSRPSASNAPDATIVATAAEQATHGVIRSRGEVDAKPFVPPNRQLAWGELDEHEIMSALSELGADDAELSLQLAREASTRFSRSSRAAERSYFEVRSLVNLGRLDEATTLARNLVAAYPDDPLANEVARHLLTHPMTHPTEIGRL